MLPGELETAMAQTPFGPQRLDSAWISVPQTEMVLERSVGPYAEQRLLLVNTTSVRGDNVVYLRAHGGDLAFNGRFQPVKLIGDLGVDIHPFTAVDDLNIQSEEDDLGILNWAEWTNNAGLTCILALRRLDSASRVLPANRTIMDMVVRNCVRGTAQQALTPARPTQAGFAARVKRPGGAPEMLSPLAGPLP
ncbi:hypothetical protein [Oceaniglobus trochenteri]|uniref:hypothetical protein n=1 Tax=Oceaniglobus trochenteri TaxID=2763260 RepID=UPI001CFF5B86|nr:hypothetical protein [Oceaniglobus trochenteri]